MASVGSQGTMGLALALGLVSLFAMKRKNEIILGIGYLNYTTLLTKTLLAPIMLPKHMNLLCLT